MQRVIPGLLAVACALLLPALLFGAAPMRQRPNILLILVDDLGYGELGCQGNDSIPTPHIDALAAGGVRCTSGYVTASYCSPSRAGLLTGRYQTRFGHEMNPVGKHNLHPSAGLPPSERTLADHLKAAGYTTGLVGKWHLGGAAPHEVLYWRMGPKTALRQGNWKIVRHSQRGAKEATFELYDLSQDLGETTDLAGRNPRRLNELKATWERYNRQMVPPVWQPMRR